MKKQLKRVITFALTLVLVLGLLPAVNATMPINIMDVPKIELDEIGVLVKGKSHPVVGTITSNTNITEATGQFFNIDGTKAGEPVTIKPNAKTLKLKSSKIDSNLKFGSLSKGNYELRITAKNSAGTASKSVYFTVDMVTIGHAEGNKDGKAGDSKGNEVYTKEWYVSSVGPWKYVIRAKDPNVAEKIAKAMEQACNNDNIGYSGSNRETCKTQAEKVGWDLSKITKKCDADCSSLVGVCVNAAGISVPLKTTMYMCQTLQETGKFYIFSTEDYTAHVQKLRRGDIILRPKTSTKGGHTMVVLTNGCNADNPVVEDNSDESIYYPRCSASCTNIKNGLSDIGVNNSLAFRKTIAAANLPVEPLFANYSGTAAQNTRMLEMLKEGILRKP